MRFSPLFVSSSLAVLVLVGSGCGPAPAPRDGASTSTPSTPSPAPSASAGACDFPYLPLRAGYKANYNSQFGGRDSSYTMSVNSVSGNGANVVYKVNDITVNHDLNCEDGLITEQGYLDLGSIAGGTRSNIRTNRVEGSIMPRDVHVGSEWSSKYDITMDYNNPQLGITQVNSIIETARKAVAMERVTVPAGSFNALKVENKYKMTITVPNATFPIPPIEFTSVEWWVEGKGMVKTQSSDTRLGNWSTEAQSITAP